MAFEYSFSKIGTWFLSAETTYSFFFLIRSYLLVPPPEELRALVGVLSPHCRSCNVKVKLWKHLGLALPQPGAAVQQSVAVVTQTSDSSRGIWRTCVENHLGDGDTNI